MLENYPVWICAECGNKHGRRPCGVATWHQGECDICSASPTFCTSFAHRFSLAFFLVLG